MKFKIYLLIFLFSSLFFAFLTPKSAFADTVTLSGSVKDSSGTAIVGATVSVNDVNSDSTTTDNSGNYSLVVLSGVYNVQVTPPAGSGFSSAIDMNQNIPTDTTLNFILTPSGTESLSGHIFDAQEHALASQRVELISSGGVITSTGTDSNGQYTLQVSSGVYTLEITNENSANNDFTQPVPQVYHIFVDNYSITQDITNLDITLPAKQVTFQVQNASGGAISGAGVEAYMGGGQTTNNVNLGNGITNARISSGYTRPITPTTDSNGNAVLWLFPTASNSLYTVNIYPPSGTNYSTATLNNVSILDSTTIPVTLQQPLIVSGHILDAQGNALGGQTVELLSSGGVWTRTSSDSTTGSYSLNVSSGVYFLEITNENSANNDFSKSVPQVYHIYVNNYSVNQSITNLDITLPAKQVTFQVQNPAGDVITGAGIEAFMPGGRTTSNINIGGGITNAMVSSGYSRPITPTTDNTGKVILWLFPTSSDNPYTVNVYPPSGSSYNTFSLNNVSVNGNQTELITLEYNHATPVTTANLVTENSDGTYSNPTTVTLSATAESGYTIANIFYTLDCDNNCTPITYTSPFTVTGSGPHTIKYWSVDNSGVQDLPNTKSFTIAAYKLSGTAYNDDNQNGFQNLPGETGVAGATVTLSSGQTIIGTTTTDASGNYSFPNLQPGTYTDTISVPSGYTATTSNPATVPVSADTTQNFGIYSKPHVGTVNVNPNPVLINTAVTATTTYTDGDSSDTHTAKVDWDGSGNLITCINVTEPNGSTPGSVSCSLPTGYSAANIYSVTIYVYDNDGASDNATNPFVSVYAPTPSGKFAAGQAYIPPLGTYAQNTNLLTNTVELALSYKYSGTMPAEQQQFMMSFGNSPAAITFSASSITSLVIANGTGTMTGTGTFSNSNTVYNFLVTGKDSTDTIRIKITDPNTNAVIYDTQPGDANTATPTTLVTGPQGQAGHGNVIAN